MKKKNQIIIGSLLVVIIILVSFFIYRYYTGKQKVNEDTKLAALIEYGYSISTKATDYYKSLFSELSSTLIKETIDEDSYAELVAQLFCTDFYNLDDKTSKNDIGGTEFVYEAYQDTFKALARNTVYHNLLNNFDGKRTQLLPIVTNTKVISNSNANYDLVPDTNAYYLKVAITYKEELGYPTEASLVLVHVDHKLEIVELKGL